MKAIDGGSFLNRRPKKAKLGSIASKYGEAEFPGYIGAIDGTKLHWKNCPVDLKGQCHNGKDGKLATIGVKACCYRDLYIWSWFPGHCGTKKRQYADVGVAPHY